METDYRADVHCKLEREPEGVGEAYLAADADHKAIIPMRTLDVEVLVVVNDLVIEPAEADTRACIELPVTAGGPVRLGDHEVVGCGCLEAERIVGEGLHIQSEIDLEEIRRAYAMLIAGFDTKSETAAYGLRLSSGTYGNAECESCNSKNLFHNF